MKSSQEILNPFIKTVNNRFGTLQIVDERNALKAMEEYASQFNKAKVVTVELEEIKKQIQHEKDTVSDSPSFYPLYEEGKDDAYSISLEKINDRIIQLNQPQNDSK